MYRPCKICKNTDQGLYVEDRCRGELICTVCGCVQSGVNLSQGNTTFSEPIAIKPPTSSDKKILRLNNQMMQKVCPKEYRDHKRNKTITDYCEKLDLLNSVAIRARLLLEKHEEHLCRIRPINNVIASCIIVSCQITKRYINVKDVEQWLDLENLNITLKIVCKTIGINQRAMILNSVPYLISVLSLPFKFENKLRELYKLACRKNPSMGSETRMALCCYKLYTDNIAKARYKEITLENIANFTSTSENSLKSYVSGKTKNSLFEKQKRKRNTDVEDISNKKSKN